MSAVLTGLAAGLCGAGISEALLAWWSKRPRVEAFQVIFAGMALRTVWMLAALVVGAASGWVETKPYVAALLGTYLTTQVFEGFRYKRFIDKR